MKKLMIMLGAVAMSFGLFADATPLAISFEAAEDGQGMGVDTTAGTFTPDEEDWVWGGDPLKLGSEERTLPYSADPESPMARRSSLFKDQGLGDNANYLTLETGKSELKRAVKECTYLDQLVQFTGFEETPKIDATAKIAVWMSGIEAEDDVVGETNLYVSVGKDGDNGIERVDLKIRGDYELGKWYRLTIKSLGDVFDGAELTTPRAGFLVYVDGKQIGSVDDVAKELVQKSKSMTAEAQAQMAAGALFPALIEEDATFATVGYQGIGAIDDIILDAEGPDFCQAIPVEFDLAPGVVVNYVTDKDGNVISAPIAVMDGTLIKVYLKGDEGMKLVKSGDNPIEKTISSSDATVVASEEDYVAEEVVATITRGQTTFEFAASELDDAISQVQDGDVVTFLAEVLFGDDAFAFTAGTTITVTEGGNWAIEVADDSTSSYECGYVIATAGVMPEKQITVTFENAETGFIMLGGIIYGDGRVDTLVKATNGTVITFDGFTVGGTIGANDGYGAILEAAVIAPATDEESGETAKIALDIGGKVITATELEVDAFTVIPEEGYALSVETNEIDETKWYTYQLEAVAPATGFMVIIAGQAEGQIYETLAEAVDAAAAGDTIKFVDASATIDDTLAVEKALTVDMNGNTLTVADGAALTLGDAVTLSNSVAAQGGFLNLGTVAVNADEDFSNLAWGQGGFLPTAEKTSKIAIAAGKTLKMPRATTEMTPNEMAENIPGFWDGTANGAFVITAGETWRYDLAGETWLAPVAMVGDDKFYTAAEALAAVQALEAAETFPIVAKALVDDLAVIGPNNQQIVLAKDETVTITPNSWVFSSGVTITAGAPIALAAGATFTVVGQLSTALFSAPEGYKVKEIDNDDGTYTYTTEAAVYVAQIGEVKYTDLHEALVAGSVAGSVVELIADVDLENKPWEPIPNFLGKFDGMGHKISNLKIDVEGAGAGLFGDYAWGKNHNGICNLVISNADVRATGNNVGVLAAKNGSDGGCVISNVTVCGNIKVIGSSYVGGLVGHNQYSHIIDCHVIGDGTATSVIGWGEVDEDGNLKGSGQIGGLVGMTGEGNMHVWNCSVEKVSVKGTGLVGGIWGRMHDSSKMVGCTATDVDVYCSTDVEVAIVKIGTLVGGFVGGGLAPVMNCSASNVKLYTLDGTPIEDRWTGTVAEGKNVALGTDVEGDAFTFKFSNPKLTAGTFEVMSDAAVTSLANWCQTGYAPVANGDGTYTIQAVYNITITDPVEGGTLETSVTNGILAGTTVTVTATPATGYELESITVNGVALEEGVTTFEMPAENVTVAATFKSVAPVNPDPTEDDPTTIPEGEKAVTRYGDKIPTALANVSAKSICLWAKGNGQLVKGDAIIENAFLLNCANTPEAVEEAEEAFKIPSITVNADGTVTVGQPEGTFNGEIKKFGKVELSDAEWVENKEGAKFFELKLVPVNVAD